MQDAGSNKHPFATNRSFRSGSWLIRSASAVSLNTTNFPKLFSARDKTEPRVRAADWPAPHSNSVMIRCSRGKLAPTHNIVLVFDRDRRWRLHIHSRQLFLLLYRFRSESRKGWPEFICLLSACWPPLFSKYHETMFITDTRLEGLGVCGYGSSSTQ